jgi:hypothetical protein
MKKKTIFLGFIALWCGLSLLSAQVTIGADNAPQPFSVLELISGNDKGLRLPQLTTQQRNDLQATAEFQTEITGKAMGLTIFNLDNLCVETWNGTKWISSCMEGGGIVIPSYPLGCPNPVPPVIFANINLGADPTYNTPKKQMHYLDTVTYPKANGGALSYDVDGTVFGGRYQWGRDWDKTSDAASHSISVDGTFVLYKGTTDHVASMTAYTDANYDNGQVKAADPNYGNHLISAVSPHNEDWIANTGGTHFDAVLGMWPDRWGNGNPVETPTAGGILHNNGNYYQSTVWKYPAYNPCPSGWRVPTQDEWERICKYDCDPSIAGGNFSDFSTSDFSYDTGKGLTWVRVKKGFAFNGTWTDLTDVAYPASFPNQGSGFAIYSTPDWTAATPNYKNGTAKLYESGAPEPLLFLPTAGYRVFNHGRLAYTGIYTLYWSSTPNGVKVRELNFGSTYVNPTDTYGRAYGASIRCVAE